MMLLPAERAAAEGISASMARMSLREPSARSGPRESGGSRRRGGRWTLLAGAASILMSFASAPAFSGAGRGALADPAPGSAAVAVKAHDSPRRLSKFEARRIRHACQGRANEKALNGAEREAFLARCYFGRLSHRAERQQCRQQAQAKGVEKAALRDYIRECVRVRSGQKE